MTQGVNVVKETEVIEFLWPVLNKALCVLHFIDYSQAYRMS